MKSNQPEQPIYSDKEIAEDLKNPFDYGSPEYLKVLAKINANREKYREEQKNKRVLQILKTKMYIPEND